RARERCVFTLPVGPAFGVSKLKWNCVFETKPTLVDLEKVARRKLLFTVWSESHHFAGFGHFAKYLLRGGGKHSAETAECGHLSVIWHQPRTAIDSVFLKRNDSRVRGVVKRDCFPAVIRLSA